MTLSLKKTFAIGMGVVIPVSITAILYVIRQPTVQGIANKESLMMRLNELGSAALAEGRLEVAKDYHQRCADLFISRSALQMNQVLTVLYYHRIMVHWSEAKPR
uniref:Tetratricopeptide repeat-containing protein n=1 Tax=Candidatus Kentrum sp. LFY TaxID=2126342 RepID=A0A450UFC1_9GAMM|nr:MAG: hypothetical protein BECKLFY1418A_GA0070994_10152 [Candidatus Kentron sp. LFY]